VEEGAENIFSDWHRLWQYTLKLFWITISFTVWNSMFSVSL